MDGPLHKRAGPTFLSIPAELRLQIYSYILPRPRFGEEYLRIYPTSVLFAFDFHVKYKISIRNILRTSRAVHTEFSEFLYQRTKFVIVDHIAQDEFWLRRNIHVVRHLEIKVTSHYPQIQSHLPLIFRIIAESQQESLITQKNRLSSLTINLEFVQPLLWGQGRQRVSDAISYMLEDRRCRIARALCTIRGLRKFDISGLETGDIKERLEKLRDRVTSDTLIWPQRDMPLAQRMSAAF